MRCEILRRLPFVLLLFIAASAAAQSERSIAARPTVPTEYSQCDELYSVNLRASHELGTRWYRCTQSCTQATCGWGVSQCTWISETFRNCIALLNDYCQFQIQMKEANEECADKVAAYKRLHDLYTATDRERDEVERLVGKVRAGVVDLSSHALVGPADKIFGHSLDGAQRVFVDARRQLNSALDAWTEHQDQHFDNIDRFKNQLSGQDLWFAHAVEVVVSNGNPQKAAKILGPMLRIMSDQGDARAAYVLGRLYRSRTNSDSLPFYLQSALLGYLPGALGVSAKLLELGLPQNAMDWIALAARQGSARAQANLAQGHQQRLPQAAPMQSQSAPTSPIPSPRPPENPPTPVQSTPPSPTPHASDPGPCGHGPGVIPPGWGIREDGRCVQNSQAPAAAKPADSLAQSIAIRKDCNEKVVACRAECRTAWNTSSQSEVDREILRRCSLRCESVLRECLPQSEWLARARCQDAAATCGRRCESEKDGSFEGQDRFYACHRRCKEESERCFPSPEGIDN